MKAGVVIIGAGQAGGRTALELARRGYTGPVTLIGAEPQAPYERPPLSKDMLSNPDTEPTYLAPAADYEGAGITLKLGVKATAISRTSREVVLDSGERIPYSKLVLATGGEPRSLPFDAKRLFTLRRIEDVTAIARNITDAKSALIIGGGVIGLEVAATLRKKGITVTVVEVGSRLLGRNFPEPVASLIADRHHAEGVEIRTGVRVRQISEDASGLHATLSDDSVLSVDLAVAGIGIIPETGLALDAGLLLDDGVVVDDAMRTSDPDILAIGDMAAQPSMTGRNIRCETWQNANITADRAVATILGEELPALDVPWFWTDQYDLNVQLAGRTGPEVDQGQIIRQKGSLDGALLFHVIENGVLVGAAAINGGRDMAVLRRLIAAAAQPDEAFLSAGSFDAKAARNLLNAAKAAAAAVSPAAAPASALPAGA